MITTIDFSFRPTASGKAQLVGSYTEGTELAIAMFKEWGIEGDVKFNDIGRTDNGYLVTECYIDSGSVDYFYFAIDVNEEA